MENPVERLLLRLGRIVSLWLGGQQSCCGDARGARWTWGTRGAVGNKMSCVATVHAAVVLATKLFLLIGQALGRGRDAGTVINWRLALQLESRAQLRASLLMKVVEGNGLRD